jgi:hypothetical protein
VIRPLIRLLFAATIAAGLVGAVRQRREAQAVRQGLLPPASASARFDPKVRYGAIAAPLADWVPARPQQPISRLVTSAWAGPFTVIGYGLALAAGRRPVWDDEFGCFVATGMRGPTARVLRLLGADANTIGQVVLSTPDLPSRVLLAHEAVHVRQAERLGPLLLPLYLWLGARYGYRDNPLERAARTGAHSYRMTLE